MRHDWILENEIGIGTAPVCHEDTKNLWDSGYRAVLDLMEPKEMGGRANDVRLRELVYINLPTPDLAEDGTGAIVPDAVIIEAVRFIRVNVAAGRPVYVHCRYGANRSAVIVTAYLCAVKKVRLYEAIRMIKERHPAANPNYRQLGAMCACLEKRGTEI